MAARVVQGIAISAALPKDHAPAPSTPDVPRLPAAQSNNAKDDERDTKQEQDEEISEPFHKLMVSGEPSPPVESRVYAPSLPEFAVLVGMPLRRWQDAAISTACDQWCDSPSAPHAPSRDAGRRD